MNIRWTRPAQQDIATIVRYIQQDKPDAAARVKAKIIETIERLPVFPEQGRKGIVEGTREIIFHPWPYIAVYVIVDDEVRILRIRHGAQEYP